MTRKTLISKLTFKAAKNLVGTLEHPHSKHSLWLNGGEPLWTGKFRRTQVADKIERDLSTERLIEQTCWDGRYINTLTPLGLQVANYLRDNWSHIQFKDDAP